MYEIKETDLINDPTNGLKYLLFNNNKWYFADDILNHLDSVERLRYVNNEIDCFNKMILKYQNNNTILIQKMQKLSNKEKYNRNVILQTKSVPHNIKFIYALEAEDHSVKIGVSDNFCRRKQQLESLSGKRFINEHTTDLCCNPFEVEALIKEELKQYKISGEWFDLEFNKVKQAINRTFKKYGII